METSLPSEESEPYPSDFFRRQDETNDALFYVEPRLLVHIDEHAISAIGQFFNKTLPRDGVLLDLMSSWRSHLPEGFPKQKLVGLGLNAVEMKENFQLDESVVHDLNADPIMPFDDDYFDAAIVTVSIQYMVRPIEVFSEVNRVLKARASFHVIYSNRMFPTKAVAVWQSIDDRQKAQLIASYFARAGGWEEPDVRDISPQTAFYTDPVHVVSARKK